MWPLLCCNSNITRNDFDLLKVAYCMIRFRELAFPRTFTLCPETIPSLGFWCSLLIGLCKSAVQQLNYYLIQVKLSFLIMSAAEGQEFPGSVCSSTASMPATAAAAASTATATLVKVVPVSAPPGAWVPDGNSQISRSYVFGPSGLKDYGSATLCCKIWSFPFLGLRPHALHPGTIQGKDGIKFCHLATLARRRLGRRRVGPGRQVRRQRHPSRRQRYSGTVQGDKSGWVTALSRTTVGVHRMSVRK